MDLTNTGQLGNIQLGTSMQGPRQPPAPYMGGVSGMNQPSNELALSSPGAGMNFLRQGQQSGVNTGIVPPQMQQRPQLSQAQMQQFQQRMGSLHPETMNALRNIPPAAMQQLHSAGIIHPGLMDHMMPSGMRGGIGSMSGNKAY
jgi:hypothetical protein